MKKIIFFLMCSVFVHCGYGQDQPVSQGSTLSDAEKIFGLSKCWSKVKYNFVYFDRLTFNWDSLYQATYLPQQMSLITIGNYSDSWQHYKTDTQTYFLILDVETWVHSTIGK